ncbi:hypothetical protein RB195_001511 [Necator americanus]|uniref:G-protein coupled receptors family 1 profile domain-containing protein n=1 Tax=Necator americanus TaxID=51031 RepID=A0ABR1DFI6_NECAM
MSNSTTAAYLSLENIAVSAIIAVVGIFGLLSNAAAMISVRCNPVLRSSFGVLCFSHSVANFGVMLVFVFWVTPMTVIHSDISSELLGKIFGQINIMFWDVCVYSHLAISLNRLISITLPYYAAELLTLRNTFLVVVVVWWLGFCHVIPYFWTNTCYISYDTVQWIWIFADSECGRIISTYTDNYTSLAVLVTIFLLDCITLIKLRLTNNIMNHQGSGSTVSLAAHKKRRQIETRFFMQTLYQNALFFYEISNFYYVTVLFTDPWAVFFTSTFAWEICHAFDGFVVVLFNFHLSFIGIHTTKTRSAMVSEHKKTTSAWHIVTNG